ncbi:MAG: SUMF1/EgtB/PvdO family nonheme iron enzyme [Anaerolineae bacterium]|nr:SUMF1/EgtB/PvdO family nonheme iron enzyme [Anaerolineae bacterium]
MVQLFISYSRDNSSIVDRLRRDLPDAGIDIWIDKVRLTPGTYSWEQALRDAIAAADAVLLCASPESRASAYVRDEVALAKQAGKAIYPAWVAGERWLDCVPLGLGGTQYADLRGANYTTGFAQLVAAVRGEATPIAPLVPDAPPEPLTPTAEPRNPYKGLRAFRAEDAGDFFGRADLVAELLRRVEDHTRPARLLPVLGASGSGKSSVILAGLLPALRQKHPDWVYLDPFVPGTQPLERLTITLARRLSSKSQRAIRDDLDDGSTRGLHRLAAEISDAPVIVYIDQFEEVFTQVNDEAERRQFIDLLTTAATEPSGVLHVLLSMRADFYDRPLQFTPFGRLIETHHVAITPMRLADLYDVVQQPAQLPDVNLRFDDGLMTEMVFAVREENAALPLLQFALDQLFQRRSGHTLTLQAYREIGGIQGALARHAEATYHALPSEQHRQLARALFLRLIEPGATEQDTTRRRAPMSELTLPDAAQTRLLQETADAFVNARLLVSDANPSPLHPTGTLRSGEGLQNGDMTPPLHEDSEMGRGPRGGVTLEVSHEALIREWARLGEWLHAAREDLRLQKALAADVAEWLRRSRPVDMLYRGTVLADALAWATRNPASQDETRFLEAGQRAEAERQRREAAAARSVRVALISLLAVITLASVAVVLILARSNTALQAEVAFTNLEIARFGTLNAGGVVVSLPTQTPGIFEPTLTGIAVLNTHDPSLPENQMVDDYGVAMVRVPAGCFFMGSDKGSTDEQPTHEICFEQAFWIDKTEVTNAQYGSASPECSEWSSAPDQPRSCVTWFEARDFCQSRDARLPTEVEWEYAARGPDSRVYPWGNDYDAALVIGYDDPDYGGRSTAPVGSRPGGASWVGALDMSGNLWEWVRSAYQDYPYRADDGREDANRTDVSRVVRGGSFGDSSVGLRAADRYWLGPDLEGGSYGFRCARSS